jgi:transcriptional regulator NrdR family protein
MRCPHCNGIKNTVINTERKAEAVVRRRLCLDCKKVYKGVKIEGQAEFVDRRTKPRTTIDKRYTYKPRKGMEGKWKISGASKELTKWLQKNMASA